MGNDMFKLVEDKDLSLSLIFLKDFLSSEKIEYLKLINEDFSLDQELFCSFFQTGSVSFKLFDIEDIGLVSFWEILLAIYILKVDNYKTKVNNVLLLFNFSNSLKGHTTDIAEIIFLSDTLISVLVKLFNIDTVGSHDQLQSVRIDNNSYVKFLFDEANEVNFNKIKEILEKNENLFNLLYSINEKARKLFEI